MDNPIYVPDYDRTMHEPVAARHVVHPQVRLVVTEGNYLASPEPGWCEVAELATELVKAHRGRCIKAVQPAQRPASVNQVWAQQGSNL